MSGIKWKIKKGDTVKVIAGDDKGKSGRVIQMLPDDGKALVEGIRIVSRHTKPNASSPNGSIVKKEAPIDLSNLMLMVGNTATKVGRKLDAQGN
ncbi:MAG: 50S ribosomal protein L24, partial [Bacteroidota bacterium]